MRGKVPRGVAAALALTCALFVATAAWAATTSFTIHKVDQDNTPIPGVEFEVYGKPSPTPKPAKKASTKRLPKTSDLANPRLWALVGGAGVGLVAAGIWAKKRKSNK